MAATQQVLLAPSLLDLQQVTHAQLFLAHYPEGSDISCKKRVFHVSLKTSFV